MKLEKVSGGYAVMGQAMVLLFLLPIVALLFYVILTKNRSSDGMIFLAFVLIIAFLILRLMFSYADIYLSQGTIVMKKLLGSRRIPIVDYKRIEKALLPFTYYIEFENGRKVYFSTLLSEIWETATSSDPDSGLKTVRLRFEKEQEASSPV